MLGALPLPRKMPKRLTAQSRRDVLARRPAESCRATAKRDKKNERERERERESVRNYNRQVKNPHVNSIFEIQF